jgi:hypothetical protein
VKPQPQRDATMTHLAPTMFFNTKTIWVLFNYFGSNTMKTFSRKLNFLQKFKHFTKNKNFLSFFKTFTKTKLFREKTLKT